MSAATDFPDEAPAGYVWTLAALIRTADPARGYYMTLPQHGHFTSKVAADERAKAVRTPLQLVQAILIELPRAVEMLP